MLLFFLKLILENFHLKDFVRSYWTFVRRYCNNTYVLKVRYNLENLRKNMFMRYWFTVGPTEALSSPVHIKIKH